MKKGVCKLLVYIFNRFLFILTTCCMDDFQSNGNGGCFIIIFSQLTSEIMRMWAGNVRHGETAACAACEEPRTRDCGTRD